MRNKLRSIKVSIRILFCVNVFVFSNIQANPIDTSSLASKIPYAHAPIGPSAINMPISEQGYRFDELDKMIMDQVESSEYMSPPTSQDPGFIGDFMLKLGKADQSKNVRKAQKICEDAIKAGRFIDKLTGGNLETMPIVKKQTLGQSDVYLIFQSAKIHPNYAEIEVYVKIDMIREIFKAIIRYCTLELRISNIK
ncbi:MAG: hypothetical protein IPJ51_20265 [Saprospiraceae bacterium]|nr:hypothetical protein [Saprospiraceae bacterium]